MFILDGFLIEESCISHINRILGTNTRFSRKNNTHIHE